MRKIIGSLVAFLLIFTFVFQVSAQTFRDISNHWAKTEIEELIEEGVIQGFNDGTFRPNAQVTRGQFLAYLVRALDLPAGTSAFPDVPRGSLLYSEIAAAKKAGLILGNSDGLSLISEPITRADVAVMLDRAMQLKGEYMERSSLTYTDSLTIGKYAYRAVERMTHYGLINGTADNTFQPTKIATRGESAVFVHRLMTKLDLLGFTKNPVTLPKPASNQEVVLRINDYQYVKVRMNTRGVPLSYMKQTSSKNPLSTDHHYYYHMGRASKPFGYMRVTLRKLDNGDTFVFTKFVHNGDNTYSASVSLPFEQSTSYSLAKYNAFGTVKQTFSSTYGYDKTTHPTGILSVKRGSTVTNEMMMGKNYISVNRQTTYSNGQKSVLREFIKELESYNVTTDPSKKTVTAKMNVSVRGKAISESWALVSEKKLFESVDNRNRWFERTIKEYGFINNWLTADGAYTKLPWSIEPGYKMGYGRNITRLQGGVYLSAYNGNKERYYRDLVVNALADLNVFSNGAIAKGQTPVFKTEYTSAGLKKSYGTTAPYIDTRLNENAALFLKNASESLSIPELATANLRYADFLVQQKTTGNIIPITATSYLIADYYAPGSKKTHVSLNHALGEMRFLLETYKQTGETKYLKTARELKAGIEKLYPKWVRPNGDLWYQVNGSLVFAGDDYDTLTLADLLMSQNAFAENGIPRSEIFDKMIVSKTKYAVKNKVKISAQISLLLQEQGFGNLIKGTSAASSTSNQFNPDDLPKDTLDLLAQ
ncbi:S-layer homology domain-containing protein [Domibacillus epiphyticus]|uniref:SLH domain-containing protein n=1 Tax=Domibacillus epiphyticus TaxID=1714355 RepID=A0A1V2A482_9BACI|nr:S-layer homology domain-containing protein [Domibacillus epiphyticus]OMP65815.1 hypothetical protein BTO28_15665 [Domibacillus epiphyticus]